MKKETKAFSGFSVADIEKTRTFYSDIMGLEVTDEMEGVLSMQIGGGARVIAYLKANHIPATFTILNFPVDDIQQGVKDLKSKGVTLESYQEENFKTDDDGIFRGGGPLIAWFKDPSGNILSIIESK